MLFRWIGRLRFLLTVTSYGVAQFAQTQHIAVAVLRRRFWFLAFSLGLVAATTAIDVWLVPLDWGPIDDVLRAPPRDVSLVILQITATASAAAIAIVLSISLLVIESTASRLSDRLVRFLANEPVGVYVIDLLAAALLVSVWGLLFFSADDRNPVATPVAAAFLLSLAVLALVVYRTHALGFLNPDSSARELTRRLGSAFHELSLKSGERPVVAYYLQRQCAELLDNLGELNRALCISKDDRDLQAMASTIAGVFAIYLPVKLQVPPTSSWFPRRTTTMPDSDGSLFLERRRIMRELGLGQPLQEKPDELWIESALWRSLAKIRQTATDTTLLGTLAATTAAVSQIASVAARWEKADASDRSLLELSELARLVDDVNLDQWGGNVLNAYAEVAEAHLQALSDLSLPGDLDQLDWRGEREIRELRLGAILQQTFLEMYGKLSLERAYSGRLVTPASAIREELQEGCDAAAEWHRDQLTRIAADTKEHFSSALTAGQKTSGATWNLVQLAIARRAAAKEETDFALGLSSEAVPVAGFVYSSLPDHLQIETRDAVEDLLITAIRLGNDALIRKALMSSFVILSAENAATDGSDFRPTIRMLSLAAYVFLSTEIDQAEQRKDELLKVLKLFRDPEAVMDTWVQLVQPGVSLSIGLIGETIHRYHDLWLDFHERIESLPKKWERDVGAIGGHEVADHPSELIQRLSTWQGGWGVEQLVEAMGEWFKNA